LPSWLLGFPDRGFRTATELGADGTLSAIEQRLWRVAYPTYQLTELAGAGSGVLVPRRIDLAHGELKLRLTIDEWRPSTAQNSP
jgi:outer membrane biogenesis lipoprotein LolB